MEDGSSPPSRERRELPAHLVAEAMSNPNGAVAEIDGALVSDPNGYVPPEAIIGVFPVEPDGRATGEFVRNPGYGTVGDDFARLESPDHWLGWLPGTPSVAVRASLAKTRRRAGFWLSCGMGQSH